MTKILKLLILCMFCAVSMVQVQAQTRKMNVPDTVCMSTSSSPDQIKFASMNAYMTGGTGNIYLGPPTWKITTPTGTAADYSVLYSANPLLPLVGTNTLTLEFRVPGTYTFRTYFSYLANGIPRIDSSQVRTLVAVDCSINTCTGGYAIMSGFNEDFGTMATGVTRRPYPVDSVIQYDYQPSGALNDDYYIISNRTNGRGNWLNAPDHTGNTNGAMLVVNSAYKPSRMYMKKVTGLCEGSVYNFSAWLLNVNIENSFESCYPYQYAGVTFQVLNAADTNQVLAKFRTYSVSMKFPSTAYRWQRYGGRFVVPPGVKDVVVRILNNKPGGCGNDIAIDDISFTYCSPIITAGLFGNNTALKEVVCEGTADTLTSTVQPANYFTDPVYQWEMSDNGGVSWKNVPYGTARDKDLKIPDGELKGTKDIPFKYLFRVRVYERGIPDSLGCANPSSPIEITILPMPQLTLSQSRVCAGADVELQAMGGFDIFRWKDLPSFVGDRRTINLISDTTITVYGYVYYGEGGGKECVDSNSATINVDDRPTVDVTVDAPNICFGETVNLRINSVLGAPGNTIRWYRGSDSIPGHPQVLLPLYDDQTEIDITPVSPADTVFSVVVTQATCTVGSQPIILKITPPLQRIKFPAQIQCSSDNPDGVFFMPDSSAVAPHNGEIGSWRVLEYSGFEVAPDLTLDDYIRIFQPARMGTRVTIPTGSFVVLAWTAQNILNNSCTITSLDTLQLVNNPTVSFAGDDTTQCVNNVFQLHATSPDYTLLDAAAETGTWTLISGNATIDDIHSPDPVITVNSPAPHDVVLSWAIVNGGGCSSNVDSITLHFALPPTAVVRPITICNTSGSFDVDTVSTFNHPVLYTIREAVPGTIPGFAPLSDSIRGWPITVPYLTTPAVPAAAAYNFILSVSTGNPGCETDIPFTVNMSSGPTAPTGVSVSTAAICDTGSTTLSVIGGNLGTRADGTPDGRWYWYRNACGGSGNLTIDSGATIIVHGINATTTYYVRAEGTCGVTACADATVTVYERPAPLVPVANMEHCNDSLFTMSATPASIGSGTWTVLNGIATITTPSSPTSTIFVLAGDTANVVWTVTNGACVLRDTVFLRNNRNVQADAGSRQEHCNTAAFTLAGNNPAAPGTGFWTLISGTATITTPTAYNSAVNVPVGDSAYLEWRITTGTCITRDTVVLVNFAPPSAAVITGTVIEHCDVNVFNVQATIPAIGRGVWSVISGTANIISPNFDTTTVIVPAGTNATLQWTVSNGTCPPNTASIILRNFAAPTPIVRAPDQTHCSDSLFTMAATPASVGAGVWSVLTGTATITTPSSPTSTIFVLAGNTASLLWTITNGVCEIRDTVVLTNNMSVQADAGNRQEHCNVATFTMTANNAAPGTGLWTILSGTPTITTPTSNTTNVTVAVGDSAYLIWTVTTGTCVTRDTVALVNGAPPSVVSAGANQTHCSDSLFTMNAGVPAVGTGYWTVISGTATIETPTSATSRVFVLSGITAQLQWTISSGSCPVTSSTVTLVNNAMPAKPNAGADQIQCETPTFNVTATASTIGTGVWTRIFGTGTITTPASNTTTVNVPTGDSTVLVWTLTNGTCTTSDTVSLKNILRANDADAGTDQAHCGQASFTLQGNDPGMATAQGTWTVVSPSTVTIAAADIHNRNAVINVPAGITAVMRWTIVNLSCSTTDDVTLVNYGPIAGNTISANQTLCAVETPAPLNGGTVSGGQGTFTYQWLISTDSLAWSPIAGATNGASYSPAAVSVPTWFRRAVVSGTCPADTSNAVKLSLIDQNPVVISVPAAMTVECTATVNPASLFGTPVFSHFPFETEPLTVTYVDTPIPGTTCNYSVRRTWTATDRCGRTASAQQTITVMDRVAPVFTGTAPANVTVDCANVPAAVNITANDACQGMMIVTPTETRVNESATCTSNYRLTRTWTAVDACGNASATLTQVITVRDVTGPVFNMAPPPTVNVDCGSIPVGAPLTANDNCTVGTITVTPVDSVSMPTGAGICSSNYYIIRKWVAADDCGNTTTVRQRINIQDTTRPVFSMSQPANITVDCDQVPALPAVTATDNCTSNVIVRVSERKDFLSTTCANNYRLTRTWTATDNCNNTATMFQVIMVQDTTRPSFNVVPPADTTISCDAVPAPPANMSASDNCSSNVRISYSQTRETIPGALCASSYRLVRTWTARDECGNTNIARQVITVADTTAPVIDPAPADITVNCGEAIQIAATLYARDNCDATFPKRAVMTEDPYVKDVCAGYTIIRRWSIADACGNNAIVRVQHITVNPCPKPELDPNLPENCETNTKFAILVANKVSRPRFTLVSVVPASAVPATPVSQNSNVFDLHGATEATFTVTDGITGCVSDPVTYYLQYAPPPVITVTPPTDICPDETLVLNVNPDGGDIQWFNGDNGYSVVISTPGNYGVRVTRNGCTVTDTVRVGLKSHLDIDLGPERDLCAGGRVTLDATHADAVSYYWNDGVTTPTREITEAGKYTISVMDRFCSQITMDSVTVSVTGLPTTVLPNDTTWCRGVPLVLTPNMGEATGIRWQDGSISPNYTVSIAGTYSVTVYNECGAVTDDITVTFKDCDPKPQFPNAFTPNGDGRNDVFKPVIQGPMYEYDLRVFNRWGEVIFMSKDAQSGWDGRYQGKLVPTGTYVWLLNYKKTLSGGTYTAKGEISVLR